MGVLILNQQLFQFEFQKLFMCLLHLDDQLDDLCYPHTERTTSAPRPHEGCLPLTP
jgi:hypothetical protein